ncbi:MAG: ATP-binding protein [Bacillota bacterium]|nr:ATP-binding protein [Bacillota bacterium]
MGPPNQDTGNQEQLRRADLDSLTFDERFGLLVDQEWLHRQNRRLACRLREAKLRLPASAEDLDYSAPRGLERSFVSTLASCRWLKERQNVLISGPTGVGKTFLLCALANSAIRQGFTARYYRLPRLIGDLGLAKADDSYPRLMARLAKTDLLLPDDWGLCPLGAGKPATFSK